MKCSYSFSCSECECWFIVSSKNQHKSIFILKVINILVCFTVRKKFQCLNLLNQLILLTFRITRFPQSQTWAKSPIFDFMRSLRVSFQIIMNKSCSFFFFSKQYCPRSSFKVQQYFFCIPTKVLLLLLLLRYTYQIIWCVHFIHHYIKSHNFHLSL